MNSIIALVIVILLTFQVNGIYGDSDIYTGIAEAPSYNGSWHLCSSINTDYISFSVRVLDDQTTPLTEGFPGETLPGDPPTPLPKYRPALNVFQLTYNGLLDFINSTEKSFPYIPSLSCYETPVQSCDQDVGDLPLEFKESQCLLLVNPTSTPVRFNATVSFVKSIFNQSFTSPNVPGGTTASNANYKFNYGIGNLMVIILFSSILLSNVIEII
ncbi:hypothetical protein RclHR1_26070001 [Rhizophagus clarus]|uniref:Uncharacterized protein n=1 Tax=Rhizophagus clarus TaxID=94130 RepID=A0A2Z6QZZ9_9GLOM|nr:hypothetical protein RclHR1_26070001 [Rhizophagus clarus]GET04091.1 hypothetical protein GLOIN_2v1560922 [Rhizophagus clarus]